MKLDELAQMLRAAGSDEQKLSVASVEIALMLHPEERQAMLREAVYAACVPHSFNPTILTVLLRKPSEDEAKELTAMLDGFSFIEKYSMAGNSNVHERTRLSLLRWLRRERTREFLTWSRRMAAYFAKSKDTYARIERIYHLLNADPKSGAVNLWRAFNEWRNQGRTEPNQLLALMLQEQLAEKNLKGEALAYALLVIALIELRYQQMDKTERRMKEALHLFRQFKNKRFEMLALCGLGDTRRILGDQKQATRFHYQALAIAQATAKKRPADDRAQRDLSVALDLVGKCEANREKWNKALDCYRASLYIAEKLVARHPRTRKLKRDLLVSYYRIGDMLGVKKNWKEAVAAYQAGVTLARKLVRPDSKNTEAKRDLAVGYVYLGNVLSDQRKWDEAFVSFQRSLQITEKLAADDSRNTTWQRDLGLALDRMGDVRNKQDKPDEGLGYHERGLKIREALAKYDPANALWQRDLSLSYNAIGGILLRQKKYKEALKFYRQDLAVATKLVKLDPKNPQWQRDVKMSERLIARVKKESQKKLERVK